MITLTKVILDNEEYYRRLSKEIGVPYFMLLNFMSSKKGVRFNRDEITNLLPLVQISSIGEFGSFGKEEIVTKLKEAAKRKQKRPSINSLDEFRKRFPDINYVSWGFNSDKDLEYWGWKNICDVEKAEQIQKQMLNLAGDFKRQDECIKTLESLTTKIEMNNLRDINRDPTNPLYLQTKYYYVKPVYSPLNLQNFFDIHAIYLVTPFPRAFLKYRDQLIKVGKEYVKRITEQARAEAMEMEALGYRFSRLHDRMLNYLSEERIEVLEENVNLDYPFMYSEFSTAELYLYYTLHTDTLFCFFQPVWHKFSDALKEILVIDKFVRNPSYENALKAIESIDRTHQMTHTTATSFLVDTYSGYKKVQENSYAVSPPLKLDIDTLDSKINFPSQELNFDPHYAALGYLGIMFDHSIDSWLNKCSDYLIGLVMKHLEKEAIKSVPPMTVKNPKELEFSYWFVNLNRIRQREVDKSLMT